MNSPAGRFSLVMQAVRATEATALAAAAMHGALAEVSVDGTIRIGEGARGQTEHLYVGERVGCGGPAVDVAVRDLTVCILDRPRHARLISEVRATGARIKLITDGDISGVIASAWPSAGVDIYMGIGGAPHGVLAAAAIACMGGQMQGRLVFRGNDDRRAAEVCGITDDDRRYTTADLASGDVTFAATGITSGAILQGVRLDGRVPVTHSLVLRAGRKEVRYIEAHHRFAQRAPVDGS